MYSVFLVPTVRPQMALLLLRRKELGLVTGIVPGTCTHAEGTPVQ